MPEPVRARRGDLAVLVCTRRDFVIGQGTTERTAADVVQVTSVTRQGLVKAVRSCWTDSCSVPLERWSFPGPEVYLVSQDRIDVVAAMELARQHSWPGHPNQPMPFESLEAVRQALAPLRKGDWA